MALIARLVLAVGIAVASAAPQAHCESGLCEETSFLQVSGALVAGRKKVTESIDSLETTPQARDLADEVDDADPKGVVKKAFAAIANGKFKGSNCRAMAATLFASDAVIDFRGPQDTNFFKKYSPGLDGVCEYFTKSADYSFLDLKLSMYTKGDRVLHILNYIPGYGSVEPRTSAGRVTQVNVVRLNKEKTRIAGVDTLFDKPSLFDELTFGISMKPTKTPQMDVVVKTFSAFADGKLKSKACQKNVADLFTADAVIDEGMQGQEQTDFFKRYSPGAAGVCEYFGKCYDALMHGLNASMYARGDDVILVLNYVPGFKDVEIEKPEPILQYNVISFSKDKSKCKGFDVFYDKPSVFKALEAQAPAKKEPKWLKWLVPYVGKGKKGKEAMQQIRDVMSLAATRPGLIATIREAA